MNNFYQILILTFFSSFTIQEKINPDQISRNVFLNDTIFVAYNSSNTKCRIDCADIKTMSDSSFRSFEKIWLFNDSEIFSTDDKTFIDSNRSIEFQSLSMDDEGSYQCCIRSLDLAYQSFVCYTTQLTVIDELPLNELNSTEAPLAPSWNIAVLEGEVLNFQPESNYFIKIFEENATDIQCLVNEVNSNIKTNNNFPPPLYNDLLIVGFNKSEHSGHYSCNGTIGEGNDTFTEMVQFTISESLAENIGAKLLEDSIVRQALSTSNQQHFSKLLILFLIFLQIVQN